MLRRRAIPATPDWKRQVIKQVIAGPALEDGGKLEPAQAPGQLLDEEEQRRRKAEHAKGYEEETRRIRENRLTPEAQAPHPFKRAEWTHPNGHPRCLLCGDDEPAGGTCTGYAPPIRKVQEVDPEGKLPALKMPDPEFNINRLRADLSSGVLSQLSRETRAGQQQFLVNEVGPKVGSSFVWGVVVLGQPEGPFSKLEDLKSTIREGLDEFTLKEFSEESDFWYIPMDLEMDFNSPIPLKAPPEGRRFASVVSLPEDRESKMHEPFKSGAYIGPMRALIMLSPYGTWAWQGKKSVILKSRDYSDVIANPMFLAEDNKIYGVVKLSPPQQLTDAEFRETRDQHLISDEQALKDWGKTSGLYAYKVKWLEKFGGPVTFERKPGSQTFQENVEIEVSKAKGALEYNQDYFTGQMQHDVGFVKEFGEVLKLLSGRKFLELGCGTGRAMRVLAASGYDIDGVDVSNWAVKHAREQGLSVMHHDMTELPFKDGSYDSVFSLHALEHVEDVCKALAESIRVANQQVVHLVPLGEGDDPGRKVTFKTLQNFKGIIQSCPCAAPFAKQYQHIEGSTRMGAGGVAILMIDKGTLDTKMDVGSSPSSEIVAKQSATSLDFKEGDEGVGVIQTHERGLSESQTKFTSSFGWWPIELSKPELARLSVLAGKAVESAYKAAQNGNSSTLAKLLDPLHEPEAFGKLAAADRKLVAKSAPVSIHTDIRLRRGKDDYWEGGEGFTPGNQFAVNKVRAVEEGTEPGKVLMSFKTTGPSHMGESVGGIIRGPLSWMKVGLGKPKVFPPGAPGSTSKAWSRFHIREAFRWIAGIQDEHFKEFWIEGSPISGRWIMQFAPVGAGAAQAGGRAWMLSRPKDQTPKSEMLAEQLKKGIDIVKSFWCPIVKADDKRLVTGIVLQPEVTDAQGDVINADVIEAAAHDFVANYNRATRMGLQHKMFPKGIHLVESWIAPVQMMLEGQLIKKGTWLVTVYVEDDTIWNDVKEGRIRGFSIGGIAKVRRLA